MTEPMDRQVRGYRRLHAALRDWIDGNQHDPGIAMAELFAYLADVLGSYQDQVAEEGYLGRARYVAIRLQEGRVTLDLDWDGSAGEKRFGLYRGLVIANVDPLGQGRLQVEVPIVYDSGVQPWAEPSLAVGVGASVPPVGAGVWVAFEEGDVDRPVWLGLRP